MALMRPIMPLGHHADVTYAYYKNYD